jgi:hypothetical protein
MRMRSKSINFNSIITRFRGVLNQL